MFTIKERNEILERIIKFLKTLDVKLIALVGSCGNDSANKFSDLDIDVVVDKLKIDQALESFKKFVQTMDLFEYFEMIYSEESKLIGAFLNNGLELDICFNSIDEFEKNRKIVARNKIKILLGDKRYEVVKKEKQPFNKNSLSHIGKTAWYNIKNAMFALKRNHLFRAVKEIEDLRNEAVYVYGDVVDIETQHFKSVDKFDENFKQQLAQSYPENLTYDKIKTALFKTLDLFYWVLEKSNADNESVKYKNIFSKLASDIKL